MSVPPAPSPLRPLAPLTQRGAWLLLAVFTLIWFANLDYRRLAHPDEGRYAEIPREMTVSGDWVTPRLDGIKYFEKPPLQYWLTAATYEAFGVRHWTARLWPALSGYLGVLFIGYVGLRLGGPSLGLYSAAALAGCLWYVLNAHILTLDAGLTLWMNVALGSLFIAQRAAASPRETRWWMWAAWAAHGARDAVEGLDRHRAARRGADRLHVAPARLGAVAATAPGLRRDHLLPARRALVRRRVCAQSGILRFLLHPRTLHPLSHHRTPTHRRVVVLRADLVGGILPWLSVFVWSAYRAWRDAPAAADRFNWQRFALLWAAVIFLFFSASGSKLPSYILPIFPALALVIGRQLLTLSSATLARLTLPLVVAGGLVTLVVLLRIRADRGSFRRRAPTAATAPWLRAVDQGRLCLWRSLAAPWAGGGFAAASAPQPFWRCR